MPSVLSIGNYAFCTSPSRAFFYSDAPSRFVKGAFDDCAEGFTIYYKKGTSGRKTPIWKGYPTKEF